MISVYNESLICDCDGSEILKCRLYNTTHRHVIIKKLKF